MATIPRKRTPAASKPPRAKKVKKAKAGVQSDELRDELPETLLGADDLASALGEAAVLRATGGDDPEEDLRDQDVEEDEGGPFVITTGRTEYARGTDASNPPDALREPRPRV